MSYKKNCPNCKEDYLADRIDQVFCSTKCRNAHNNKVQVKLNRPYQTIAKNLKSQDELLMNYARNPDIRLHSDHFIKNGIIVNHAFRFTYDSSKNLSSIVFVKYKLVSIGNSYFKIEKTC